MLHDSCKHYDKKKEKLFDKFTLFIKKITNFASLSFIDVELRNK